MNYSKIFSCDTNNGDGFRVTLFVSGCTLNCKNCHNKDAQNFTYGNLYTKKTEDKIIELMSKDYIRGFSLLGGEPFDNLIDNTLIALLKRIKQTYPNKTIYCWSGYTFEELLEKPNAIKLLKYIDMLRDGRYIEELKDLNQYLQGSTNQRYINCSESIKQNKTIEFDLKKERINK